MHEADGELVVAARLHSQYFIISCAVVGGHKKTAFVILRGAIEAVQHLWLVGCDVRLQAAVKGAELH